MIEKYRKVKSRWVLTAELVIETAAQIGSHEADYCDQTFGRNHEGKPLLQGTTLSGALRTALNDRLTGYRSMLSQSADPACRLFGDIKLHESPIIVFDSIAAVEPETSIRDGVRIEPGTGLAQDGKKFDRELSLPGLVFPIRLELVVSDKTHSEEELLAHLANSLEALSDGSIRFGARKSRGLGVCSVNGFRATRFNLETCTGWLAYAALDHENPHLNTRAFPTAREAIEAARQGDPSLAHAQNTGKKMTMAFNLDIDGTLLIRTPGQRHDSADAIHLTEKNRQGEPVAILSGASVAGAFRAQANRILNTIACPHHSLLDDLFGTSPEAGENGKELMASRVIFSECLIKGNRVYRQTRVKIDRFTGGAFDSALFDEEPAVGGRLEFVVQVLNPRPADTALLLLTARDLLEGFFTVGGGASVGRGRLCGSVTVNAPGLREFELSSTGITGLPHSTQQDLLNALTKAETAR